MNYIEALANLISLIFWPWFWWAVLTKRLRYFPKDGSTPAPDWRPSS